MLDVEGTIKLPPGFPAKATLGSVVWVISSREMVVVVVAMLSSSSGGTWTLNFGPPLRVTVSLGLRAAYMIKKCSPYHSKVRTMYFKAELHVYPKWKLTSGSKNG